MPNPSTSPFEQKDLNDLLISMGYGQEIIFVDQHAKSILVQLARSFLEEVLDTYALKKKELTIDDVRSAIELKFPEISAKNFNLKTQMMKKRTEEINRMDDRQ